MIAFSSASSIGSSARWTRRRTARGQLVPGGLDLGEHLGALGVVGDRADVGAGEQQVRVSAARTCSAKPARTPSGSLRRSHRDTCASSGRRAGAEPPRASRRGGGRSRRCRRAARTPRGTDRRGRGQAGGAQHRGDARERHALVLGRERVDRRRDHASALRDRAPPRRTPRARTRTRRPPPRRDEEAPRLAREVVGQVEADVRPPDQRDAAPPAAGEHPGGLRVVEDHDVAGRTPRRARRALASQRRSYASRSASPSGPPSPRSRGGGCAGAW